MPPTTTNVDESTEPVPCQPRRGATGVTWDARAESDGRSRDGSVTTGGAAWWPLGSTSRSESSRACSASRASCCDGRRCGIARVCPGGRCALGGRVGRTRSMRVRPACRLSTSPWHRRTRRPALQAGHRLGAARGGTGGGDHDCQHGHLLAQPMGLDVGVGIARANASASKLTRTLSPASSSIRSRSASVQPTASVWRRVAPPSTSRASRSSSSSTTPSSAEPSAVSMSARRRSMASPRSPGTADPPASAKLSVACCATWTPFVRAAERGLST